MITTTLPGGTFAMTDDLTVTRMGWLLQRSPNILLIPGTSSVTHLRENVTGAALNIPDEELAQLDAVA
jgi:aryl-alcohol dehydrogenase-like predicted oxidoreductase